MNIELQDPKYQELSNDIKLAAFKEIFSIISHTLSKGYIDSFGVVTGVNKNNAYLVKYTISHPVFVECFKHAVMDFDDMYTIFKEPKKNIRCAYDPETHRVNEYAMYTESSCLATPIIYPEPDELFNLLKSYDNPHLFKETDTRELNISEFSNAILNDYTYRSGHYIITKEAVPKPKKITLATYSISEIATEGEESYIYYTTKIKYDFVDMTIASKVINLD